VPEKTVPEKTVPEKTVPGEAGGLRVLVVDDVAEMQAVIRRALSANGYQVDVAATLAGARAMDPSGYDAVLVDLRLGPERGLDLVEELRSKDPAAARRCLVMTGGSTDALPDGIAYLAKPFELGELVDAVRALHQPDTGPVPTREAGKGRDFGIVRPPASVPPSRDPAASVSPSRDPTALVPPSGNSTGSGEAQAWQLLTLTRRLRAHERQQLADFLHDGPVQELTAATLELQMTSRAVPAAPGFSEVAQRLSAAAASLRWLMEQNSPSLASDSGLAAALRQRTAWLLAAPVTIDTGGTAHADGTGGTAHADGTDSTDGQAAGLDVIEVPVIVDVVELMLLVLLSDRPPAQVHVAVRAQENIIRIELTLVPAAGDGQAMGDPAPARAALDGLGRALGASVHATLGDQHWLAQIILRRQRVAAVRSGHISE